MRTRIDHETPKLFQPLQEQTLPDPNTDAGTKMQSVYIVEISCWRNQTCEQIVTILHYFIVHCSQKLPVRTVTHTR